MYKRPRPNQVLPAVMHPTKCCVNQTCNTYEVPHIHPTHTTNVNNVMYQHKHYFPQTQSQVDSVSHQHFNCGGGPGGPGGPQGPGGPGGPGFGPGFGPGPRPRPPFGPYGMGR
ncbi:CotD family spore coat protein [Rossellomorea aquimaris]|jgi:spore coat protein D|uniref:CotD family spore coat protein n=1 Tax=Bacillaceae TaxID=186817 RepID=UPI0011ED78F5|nr:CotD family spore coat protein [Bacillus sp. CH30_1T]KAA0562668.1 spore coat protein CotD [Bacillus sp. CH30_1T]